MIDYSARKSLYIIVVLAIIIRLFIALFLLKTYNAPELFEYEIIANNILTGKGFLYNFCGMDQRAFIQPFYPVFTAVVYYLTNHSHLAMIIIQSLISSLLAIVIYSIAMRFTGKSAALLAAVLVALHPGLIVYSTFKLHPLVLDAFFYLLTISLILKFMKLPSIKNGILTGSVMGLSLLSRSTIVLFIIFSFICMFFILNSLKITARIRYLLIIGLSTMIVYSPWVIRNYKVFHSFVFMQTCSGENLWIGNNMATSGSAVLISGDSIYKTMPEDMRQELGKLDELGQLKYYNNYFVNFIREKPRVFIKLFLKKFYYFWWFSPHTGILYKNSWLHIYKTYYAFIVLFALYGVSFPLKNKVNYATLSILFTYMLSISFIHAVVNIDTRHRWTVEPVIIIFASIGAVNIVRYLKGIHLKNA